jgi:prepilin-type N-terminal cleavage/methylation domain-containing protein
MNSFCGRTIGAKQGSGFTLVELMLVVALIATLANFALPEFSKAVLKSRLSELVVEIDEFRTQYEVIRQTGDIDVLGTSGYSMALMPEELKNNGLRAIEYPGLKFSVVAMRSSQGFRLALAIIDLEGSNIEVLVEMLPLAAMLSDSTTNLLFVELH